MKEQIKNDEMTVFRGQWRWRVRPGLSNVLDSMEKKIISPEGRGQARAMKITRARRLIWTVPLPEAGLATAFVKHYSRARLAKQLKHLVRNSRTRQEWEMGLALETMGLPVARHLAMAERRVFGLLKEDYLVQEALIGYKNFDDWFRERWEEVHAGVELADKRAVILRLAALIRRLHDLGVMQRDFKPDSIMVGPEGEFKLVDLERVLVVSKSRGLSLSRRLDNLAKIDQTFGFIGTATDRGRFLHEYFGGTSVTGHDLGRYALTISRLAELKFRKRARERRVWTSTENETYTQFTCRGFRVSAHRSLSRAFIRSVIKRMPEIGRETLHSPGAEGWPDQELKAVWCDARTAFAHTPSLYFRKVPFVPARAAIYPSSSRWGLLLYLAPGPPHMSWKQAFKSAGSSGSGMEPAGELGQCLRILHRMGITWKQPRHDTLLYDPTFPDPLQRFYLNRLDLIILDRSPKGHEADRVLAEVQHLLGLTPPQAEAMRASYEQCQLRWFRGVDRW